MALFTSTPKTYKHEEKEALLRLELSDDEKSSGYDSPIFIHSEDDEGNHSQNAMKQVYTHSSNNSDFSSDETDNDSTYGDDSRNDYPDDGQSLTEDSMKVTPMKSPIGNIQNIMSIPNLCVVTFLVGPERIPVCGLKLVLGAKSRVFFNMFLNQSEEEVNNKKNITKSDENQNRTNKMQIIIENYDVKVFRTFIMFLHCGSVILDASNVVGLLCCAIEFEIPDLKEMCYEFVSKCLLSAKNCIVMKEIFRYADYKNAMKFGQHVVDLHKKKTSSENKIESNELHQVPVRQENPV